MSREMEISAESYNMVCVFWDIYFKVADNAETI